MHIIQRVPLRFNYPSNPHPWNTCLGMWCILIEVGLLGGIVLYLVSSTSSYNLNSPLRTMSSGNYSIVFRRFRIQGTAMINIWYVWSTYNPMTSTGCVDVNTWQYHRSWIKRTDKLRADSHLWTQPTKLWFQVYNWTTSISMQMSYSLNTGFSHIGHSRSLHCCGW